MVYYDHNPHLLWMSVCVSVCRCVGVMVYTGGLFDWPCDWCPNPFLNMAGMVAILVMRLCFCVGFNICMNRLPLCRHWYFHESLTNSEKRVQMAEYIQSSLHRERVMQRQHVNIVKTLSAKNKNFSDSWSLWFPPNKRHLSHIRANLQFRLNSSSMSSNSESLFLPFPQLTPHGTVTCTSISYRDRRRDIFIHRIIFPSFVISMWCPWEQCIYHGNVTCFSKKRFFVLSFSWTLTDSLPKVNMIAMQGAGNIHGSCVLCV